MTSSPDLAAEDVRHVLTLLKRAIRSSGLSQKEVDRRIGVKPGYLSQVMIGRLDLKLKHLYAVLNAIEVEPEGFFDLAFPAPGGGSSGRGVLKLLSRETGSDPPPAANDLEQLPDEELQRLVLRALAEELGVGKGPGEDGEG